MNECNCAVCLTFRQAAEPRNETPVDGYEPLKQVLDDALAQASRGKGKERHAGDLSFMDQPIITEGREMPQGLAFQARKKIREALNCPDDDRAVTDLLGAIVYTAAMVILRREK